MGVKLAWVNRGTVPLDAIKVYRSNTKGGSLTLIATLPGDALSYEDTTMPMSNVVYWYQVSSVLGTAETYGALTPVGHFSDSGPGPKKLRMGDWEFGYFGEVTTDMSLLPTFSEVAAAGGFTKGNDTPTVWRKFIVGGKIIYVPNAVIGVFSTTELVNYKLMKAFGNNASPILTVDKGNYGFKVRIPRCSTVLDLGDTVTLAGDATKLKSELCAQIMCHVNWDVKAEDGRWFKGSGRFADDSITSTNTGSVLLGYQSATGMAALQYNLMSNPISPGLGSSMTANVIYELDFS